VEELRPLPGRKSGDVYKRRHVLRRTRASRAGCGGAGRRSSFHSPASCSGGQRRAGSSAAIRGHSRERSIRLLLYGTRPPGSTDFVWTGKRPGFAA